MTDIVEFEAPTGWLGPLGGSDWSWLLKIPTLIEERNRYLAARSSL